MVVADGYVDGASMHVFSNFARSLDSLSVIVPAQMSLNSVLGLYDLLAALLLSLQHVVNI
jgi:hypothetical protein